MTRFIMKLSALLLASTLGLGQFAYAKTQLPSASGNVKVAAPKLAVASGPVEKQTPAKWTVMVYVNGNSNLAPDTLRIVDEMERIGSTRDVQMVVHMSRATKHLRAPAPYYQDRDSGLILPSHQIIEPDDIRGGTVRYHVVKDKLEGSVTSIPIYAEGNPASPATLFNFLRWAKQAYPADRYMLMIYGHGAGFMGTSAGDAAGGGSRMEINDLGDVLRSAGGVDVLFFYSCLMQMAEVSAQLEGGAKLVVGSETSMITGVPFDGMFSKISSKAGTGDVGPTGMADIIYNVVAQNDTRHGMAGGPTFALSAVKPSGLKKVLPLLDDYVQTVMDSGDLSAALVARDHAKRMHDDQDSLYYDYADLGYFVMVQASVSKNPQVKAAAQALFQSLQKDYVVRLAQSTDPESKKTTGVSIYLPCKEHRILTPAEMPNGLSGSKWMGFLRWMNMDR